MAHGELVDYIKKATEHGQTKEQIHANLINAGWLGADIDAAFSSMEGAPVPPVPMASHQVAAVESNPLPSAVEMLKRAWGIFMKRIWTFVAITAVSTVFTIIYQLVYKNGNWIWYLVIFILTILVQLLASMATIFAVQGGESVGIGEAYRRAFGKFHRAIWLAIIFFIITTGLSCYFYIPGFIASGWFLFAFYVLAIENHGGMNALFYSREYVRGKWWMAVGYTLLPPFVAAIIAIVLGSILWILHVPYYQEIIANLIGLVFSPIMIIYMYMVYVGLKAEKGQVTVRVTAGRKAKYIIFSLLGVIVLVALLGGSVLAMVFAARGNGPIPGATHAVPSGLNPVPPGTLDEAL